MKCNIWNNVFFIGISWVIVATVPQAHAWDTLFDDTSTGGVIQPRRDDRQPRKEKRDFPRESLLDRAKRKGLVKDSPPTHLLPDPQEIETRKRTASFDNQATTSMAMCGTPSLQMKSVNRLGSDKKDPSQPDLLFVSNGDIWGINKDGSNEINLTHFANDTDYQQKLRQAMQAEGLTWEELSSSPMSSPIILDYLYHPQEGKIYFSLNYHSDKRVEFHAMNLDGSQSDMLATFENPASQLQGINKTNMFSATASNKLLQFLEKYPWLGSLTPGADALQLPSVESKSGMLANLTKAPDDQFNFSPGERKKALEQLSVTGGTSP